MQKDDLSTSKFRAQLPLAIHPVSPTLAALHATRARLLHHPGPDTDVLKDTNCTKCGAYLLDGTGSIRTVRKTRKSRTKKGPKTSQPYVRVLRRSCGMCGCEEDLPLGVAKEAMPKVGPIAATGPSTLPTQQRAGSSQSFAASTSIASQSRSPSIVPLRQSSPVPSSMHTRPPSAAPSPIATPALPSTANSKVSTPFKLSPAPSPAPSTLDARAKARPRKKAGLHDMLARNRERQEQEKKAGVGGGLAAFLEGL